MSYKIYVFDDYCINLYPNVNLATILIWSWTLVRTQYKWNPSKPHVSLLTKKVIVTYISLHCQKKQIL